MTDDVYLWETNSGCPLCDGMAGYHYGEEPTQPHPFCECDISLVNDGGAECYVIELELNGLAWGDDGDLQPSDRVEVGYDFEIHCWHGGGMSGTGDMDVDASDAFEYDGGFTLGADDWPIVKITELEELAREHLQKEAEDLCECDKVPPGDLLVS